MRGLDPRIHPSARANGTMVRRVKPGDDSENMQGASALSWSRQTYPFSPFFR